MCARRFGCKLQHNHRAKVKTEQTNKESKLEIKYVSVNSHLKPPPHDIRRFGLKFLQFQFSVWIFLGTKINETTSVCNYEVSHSWKWKHIAIGRTFVYKCIISGSL